MQVHWMRISSMRIECAFLQSTLGGGLEADSKRIAIEMRGQGRKSCDTGPSHTTPNTTRHHRRVTNEVTMSGGWTHAETRALTGIWGESNVQQQLDKVRRNRDIYERISRELSKQGWTKSWKQCRVKVKNLTQSYRKVCLCAYTHECTSQSCNLFAGEGWEQCQWTRQKVYSILQGD